MDISKACKTIRARNDPYSSDARGRSEPGDLPAAVSELKRYLELQKADGRPIRELEIADALLATLLGVRYVMPFPLIAEAMEASKRWPPRH